MKGNSKTTKCTDRVFIHGQMEISMKEVLLKTKKMGLELSILVKGRFTMVNLRMGKCKETVLFIELMDLGFKDTGKMEPNPDRDKHLCRMA
mmetsp:Transcript_27494/g.5056  ORF Transcript_27494/g.5056 Transcript_27494/m.5056 type:complete len:91 (-) Transcript_27494:228-500(-)